MADKTDIVEVFDLVKAYAKQETLDPLRGAGRYLAFGVVGSLLVALGAILLTISLLRLLQSETDTSLSGNLSWVPYAVAIGVAAVVAALIATRISKKPLG